MHRQTMIVELLKIKTMAKRELNELEQAIANNRLFDLFVNGELIGKFLWYDAQSKIQQIMSDDYNAICWTRLDN